MKIVNLIKTWSLPERSSEKVPVQLRLPFDIYASLHALKDVYPEQSVNDIARDLLRAAISEVVENLPSYTHRIDPAEADYIAQAIGGDPDFNEMVTTGPLVNYENAYARIMGEKKQEEVSQTELRAVS